MPEHVHLIVCPRQPAYSMSHVLKAIKEPVGRQAMAPQCCSRFQLAMTVSPAAVARDSRDELGASAELRQRRSEG